MNRETRRGLRESGGRREGSRAEARHERALFASQCELTLWRNHDNVDILRKVLACDNVSGGSAQLKAAD
eukprot:273185-Pleurochrysis_carterae.AAC.2